MLILFSIGGVIGTGKLLVRSWMRWFFTWFFLGLFLGSATSLRNGGPVGVCDVLSVFLCMTQAVCGAGLLLGYMVVGSICYTTMVRHSTHLNVMLKALQISLGEMVSFLPVPGGHIKLAGRFVDPGLSFAMGWNYWYRN